MQFENADNSSRRFSLTLSSLENVDAEPVARLHREKPSRRQAFRQNPTVLQYHQSRHSKANVLVRDSCSDNPAERSASKQRSGSNASCEAFVRSFWSDRICLEFSRRDNAPMSPLDRYYVSHSQLTARHGFTGVRPVEVAHPRDANENRKTYLDHLPIVMELKSCPTTTSRRKSRHGAAVFRS